jgi:uncharacterized membrane protein
MNKDIILGIVRHVLTIGAGVLVTKGLTDSAGAETIVGSLVGIVGVVWSIFSKKKASEV